MRVCIIDSGYNKTHSHFENVTIASEKTIALFNDCIHIKDGAEDRIGHGTAILSIFNRMCKNAEYHIIKIFEDSYECDEDLLINALEYVYDNISCDFINLSLGITQCANTKKLNEICSKLVLRNTIIVSAFDNNGAVSYPAAFYDVIGVDIDVLCKTSDKFISVKNSIVNALGYGNTQRVAWVNPEYMFVSGASFANAYITSILVNARIDSLNDALIYLYDNSFLKIDYPEHPKEQNGFKIIKAIALPFNKEIKSLLDNYSMIDFELSNIFDYPKLGNVGGKFRSLDNLYSIEIKNICDIDWGCDFDTVILGHMNEINNIIGYDLRREIVKLCIQNNKNIFCYDYLNYDFMADVSQKIYTPEKKYCNHNFGKLYEISTPVLGIMGTSSRQGKFTLQIILRNMFIQNNYHVGQIGTEPSSLLFGMDDVFHFGFDSNFNLSSNQFVASMNYSLKELQDKDVDIIISGCQSNTIPYTVNNIRYLNFRQSEYLIGLNPDCCILCINPYDDIKYITRTMNYIESSVECKVIALVIYPMDAPNMWASNYRKKMDETELFNIKNSLADNFRIPCFILGEQRHMGELFETVINFFSNE